jgi:hypothetical protein
MNNTQEIPFVKIKVPTKKQIESAYRDFGRKYRDILVKEMGFEKSIRLKSITNHPIAKREKVLYVLPDNTCLYYDKKTKEYKNFDVLKWSNTRYRKKQIKLFWKNPFKYIFYSIRNFFRRIFRKILDF